MADLNTELIERVTSKLPQWVTDKLRICVEYNYPTMVQETDINIVKQFLHYSGIKDPTLLLSLYDNPHKEGPRRD